VVGGNISGTVVPSKLLSNGSLQLTISQAVSNADQYSWVFKIPFGGVDAANGMANGGSGSNATATYSAAGGPASQTTSGGVQELGDPFKCLMVTMMLGSVWLLVL